MWHSRLTWAGTSFGLVPRRSRTSRELPPRSPTGRAGRVCTAWWTTSSLTGRGSRTCPAARISASNSSRKASFLCAMAMSSSLSTNSAPLSNRRSSSRIIAFRVLRRICIGMWRRRVRASPRDVISPAVRRGRATSSKRSANLMRDSLG